jgi:sensor histidine kinase regulating citrate/malate metabolism
MEILVTSQFKELNMPSWEFCRVLGNIIDNGIYALQEKSSDRHLRVELYEDIKMYRFRIKNNGPQVPENIKNKLFEAGFTTKGEDGQGMGLYIVKELVESYGGDISLYSNEDVTIFDGYIKK